MHGVDQRERTPGAADLRYLGAATKAFSDALDAPQHWTGVTDQMRR
jgi:hypothetical protein